MTSRNRLPPSHPDENVLVAKCQKLGAPISRLDDFRMFNEYRSHPDKLVPMSVAIASMLANELANLKFANVRHIVMHVIAQPEFRKEVLQPIVEELLRDGKDYHGQPAANALDKIVIPDDSGVIAELLLNKEIGDARALLVSTYARIAKKSGIPVLRKIVDDAVTRSEALRCLSILGDITIEPNLLELAKHPDSYHRKIARDALKRVERNKLKRGAKDIH
jgi:hypothetical protein